jgi:Siphovirus Gp157
MSESLYSITKSLEDIIEKIDAEEVRIQEELDKLTQIKEDIKDKKIPLHEETGYHWTEDEIKTAKDELLSQREGLKEVLIAYMQSSEETANQKIDNICFFKEDRELRADSRKTQKEKYALLESQDRRASERAKHALEWYLEKTGKSKISTTDHELTYKASGQNPVIISESFEKNPELLPEQFRKATYSPVKSSIKSYLDSKEADVEEVPTRIEVDEIVTDIETGEITTKKVLKWVVENKPILKTVIDDKEYIVARLGEKTKSLRIK